MEMDSYIDVDLNLEELELLLSSLSKETNQSLYDKLREKYECLLFDTKAISILKEHYKSRFFSCYKYISHYSPATTGDMKLDCAFLNIFVTLTDETEERVILHFEHEDNQWFYSLFLIKKNEETGLCRWDLREKKNINFDEIKNFKI